MENLTTHANQKEQSDLLAMRENVSEYFNSSLYVCKLSLKIDITKDNPQIVPVFLISNEFHERHRLQNLLVLLRASIATQCEQTIAKVHSFE